MTFRAYTKQDYPQLRIKQGVKLWRERELFTKLTGPNTLTAIIKQEDYEQVSAGTIGTAARVFTAQDDSA